MTYPGICSPEHESALQSQGIGIEPEQTQTQNDQDLGYCNFLPQRCLHGLLDGQNLQKNVRLLNQYYDKSMSYNTDFDERYFININGLSRTPLKLINSISPPRKSPPSKGNESSNNSGTFKRPKKDIDLSFGSADHHF